MLAKLVRVYTLTFAYKRILFRQNDILNVEDRFYVIQKKIKCVFDWENTIFIRTKIQHGVTWETTTVLFCVPTEINFL